MNFSISVVIPSKNNGRTIDFAIKSVLSAISSTKKLYSNKFFYEVIVVDAHSTDKTPQILQKYVKRGWIKVIYDEGKGLGPARNLALNYAKGDIVFFVDADCIVEHYHFVKFLNMFESDERIAIVWTPGYSTRKMEEVFPKTACKSLKLGHNDDVSYPVKPIEDTVYAAGAFLAVRSSVALRIKGFWNTPWAADDIEFSYRVWKAGYRVVKILTRSIALPRMTLCDLWRQQVWYGTGVVCFYMRHRYDPVFWRTRGKSLYTLFKLLGPSLAMAWVVLRALFSPFRALRLWFTRKLGLNVVLLLAFNRYANLVGMLKGLIEYRHYY